MKDRSVSYVRKVLEGEQVAQPPKRACVKPASCGCSSRPVCACLQRGLCLKLTNSQSTSSTIRLITRAELPEVLTSTPVASIERLAGRTPRVRVQAASGAAREFDAVVLATHSDTALKLLGGGATPAEREVLGAIPYNE